MDVPSRRQEVPKALSSRRATETKGQTNRFVQGVRTEIPHRGEAPVRPSYSATTSLLSLEAGKRQWIRTLEKRNRQGMTCRWNRLLRSSSGPEPHPVLRRVIACRFPRAQANNAGTLRRDDRQARSSRRIARSAQSSRPRGVQVRRRFGRAQYRHDTKANAPIKGTARSAAVVGSLGLYAPVHRDVLDVENIDQVRDVVGRPARRTARNLCSAAGQPHSSSFCAHGEKASCRTSRTSKVAQGRCAKVPNCLPRQA